MPRWVATPLGLGRNADRHPRVAEYSNPGLWDATPLGLPAQTKEFVLPRDCRVKCEICFAFPSIIGVCKTIWIHRH